MRSWFFLFAPIMACSGDDATVDKVDDAPLDGDADTDADTDSDTDTDTDSDTDADCVATIIGVDPNPASLGVPLDTLVTVDFSDAIGASDPWSVDVVGAKGSAELASDGLSAVWTPQGTLSGGTTYTVDAAVCEDANSSLFTTSIDLADVEGNTYGVPWNDLVFTEPAGLGGLIGLFVQIDYILLQIDTIDPVTLQAQTTATTATDEKGIIVPECLAAVQEVGDFSLNPVFAFGPQDVDITGLVAEALELQGEITPDGQAMENTTLSALIATEQFKGFQPCDTDIIIQGLGGTCAPCATSTKAGVCLVIEANTALADIVPVDIVAECAL